MSGCSPLMRRYCCIIGVCSAKRSFKASRWGGVEAILAARADLRGHIGLVRALEQLERLAVGILDLNLLAARAGFHPVAEIEARIRQLFDRRREIGDLEDDSVPAAGLLCTAIGHGAGPRCSGAAQDQLETGNRNLREGRWMLAVQLEAEVSGIEVDRALDVLHLISDAVESGLEHVGLLSSVRTANCVRASAR